MNIAIYDIRVALASWLIVVALTLPSPSSAAIPPDLHLTLYASGLNNPLAIRSPRDGSGRMFVLERNGRIRMVAANGSLLATPYYTRAVDTGDVERGLLGLAFDPNFSTNGTLYIVYTEPGSGGLVLRRLVTSSPASNTFSGSDTIVMRVPLFYNHNGGDIHFGSDGYLYWSTGSGTGSFDPENLAQNLWKRTTGGLTYYLMGKMLRIDVRTPIASATANMCGAEAGQPAQYSIPAGNPYATTTGSCAEILLYGFRNPWRWSFDRKNGDMWISDVGEGAWEEIDMRPAGATTNRNYGYPQCEGNHPGRPSGTGSSCPATTSTVGPVMEYSHANNRCSVTGGVRYRGPIQALNGHYIFGDACSSEVFIATQAPAGGWSFVTFPSGIAPGYGTVSGFGEGANGELYLVDHQNGRIWRFDAATTDLIFRNSFDP